MENEIKVRNITDLENEIVYTINEKNVVVAARDLYGNMLPIPSYEEINRIETQNK